jgi:hypothetical protein
MGFKLKSVAAAVAFAAVAGQASAFTATDVIFYAFDATNGSSFVQDLGATSIASLTAPVSVAGADWTSFSGQATYAADAAAGNVKWGLLLSPSATAFTSTIGAGQTAAIPASAGFSVINTNVAGALALAIGAPATSFAAAGSLGNNNWNVIAGTNLAASTPFTTGNLIGATGVALDAFTPAPNARAKGTMTALAQTAGFTGSTLTVAAVPEPETYAMMVAGLLMIGAIARRRSV